MPHKEAPQPSDPPVSKAQVKLVAALENFVKNSQKSVERNRQRLLEKIHIPEFQIRVDMIRKKCDLKTLLSDHHEVTRWLHLNNNRLEFGELKKRTPVYVALEEGVNALINEHWLPKNFFDALRAYVLTGKILHVPGSVEFCMEISRPDGSPAGEGCKVATFGNLKEERRDVAQVVNAVNAANVYVSKRMEPSRRTRRKIERDLEILGKSKMNKGAPDPAKTDRNVADEVLGEIPPERESTKEEKRRLNLVYQARRRMRKKLR